MSDPIMSPKSYVEFHDAGTSPSRKTRLWTVSERGGGAALGTVQWFARWRCYAFWPESSTVYERRCLRDIATFCEDRTNEHKKGAQT